MVGTCGTWLVALQSMVLFTGCAGRCLGGGGLPCPGWGDVLCGAVSETAPPAALTLVAAYLSMRAGRRLPSLKTASA